MELVFNFYRLFATLFSIIPSIKKLPFITCLRQVLKKSFLEHMYYDSLMMKSYNTRYAEDGNRTRTVVTHRRILSPVRLPVPPPRHVLRALQMVGPEGLEPPTNRL